MAACTAERERERERDGFGPHYPQLAQSFAAGRGAPGALSGSSAKAREEAPRNDHDFLSFAQGGSAAWNLYSTRPLTRSLFLPRKSCQIPVTPLMTVEEGEVFHLFLPLLLSALLASLQSRLCIPTALTLRPRRPSVRRN